MTYTILDIEMKLTEDTIVTVMAKVRVPGL